MKITRRRFLQYSAAAGAAALAFDGLIWEPGAVEFTEHLIESSGGSNAAIRFAQLSDLHLTGVGAMHRTIAEHLSKLDLDCILITGDAIDGNHHLPDLDELLSLFPRALPKYAILGNWEHWGNVNIEALRALYARHGGELLVNATATLATSSAKLLISGIDDIAGAPSIELALRGVEPAENHIILAHSPVYRDYLADYNRLIRDDSSRINPTIDFDSYNIRHLFAGHTHGGQVNLAGATFFMPPGSGEYVKGWYRERAPAMYISRGIGTSILPVRIGSRPEVAVFEYR